jgi:hypothetical protein
MVSKVLRAACLALLTLALAHASGAEQKLTAGDLDVYYGFVPAEVVKKQPDAAMHKARVRAGFRHLVVAVYDQKTGERVSNATVTATVTPLGLTP